MQTNCDLIKDLIPLYVENLCSDTSRRIVEEHIETCDTCNGLLDSIAQDNTEKTFEDYIKRVKDPFLKIRKKYLLNTGIAIVCTVCLILAVNFAYMKLFVSGWTAPTSVISVTHFSMIDDTSFEIECVSDTGLVSYFSMTGNHNNENGVMYEDGIVYFSVGCVYSSPFGSSGRTNRMRTDMSINPGIDGQMYGDKITAVYLCGKNGKTSEDIQLIWQSE